MSTRRRRTRASTPAAKAFELGVAAPQVIAHRLTRMAMAGGRPNTRDRKEFTGMVIEKQIAFGRSWMDAWQRVFRAQAELATWAMRHSASIANAAIAPVHAKATSNARRLSRVRRRR